MFFKFQFIDMFQLCNMWPHLEMKIGELLFICGVYCLMGNQTYHLGQPKLLNLLGRRPFELEEIKKGLETYILFWKKGIENGGDQYWNPEISYWKTIHKALDKPFHRTDF